MARLRCLNPEDFAETNRPLLALRRHSSPGYAVGLYRVSTACHRSTALEVSFVRLSPTIIAGSPRSATIRSRSRTAAVPPPSARLRAPKGGPFCTPPRCQRNQR